MEDLEAIRAAARVVFDRGRPPNTVDMYAEEDGNGVVTIYEPDGTPVAMMSRGVLDALGLDIVTD